MLANVNVFIFALCINEFRILTPKKVTKQIWFFTARDNNTLIRADILLSYHHKRTNVDANKHRYSASPSPSSIKGVTFRQLSLGDKVKVKVLSAPSSLICDLTHFRERERERLRCQAYYAGMRSNPAELPELSVTTESWRD